jgi:FAD:protein FMN transferase
MLILPPMKFTRALIYAAVLAFIMVSCSKNEKLKLTGSFSEFTTNVNITVFGLDEKDTVKVQIVFSKSREIFRYFEKEMNSYNDSSALSELNRLEPGRKIEVPPSLKEILKISRNIHKYTDGAFDVAVLPVVKIWGRNISSGKGIPDKAEIEEALSYSVLDCYDFSNDSVSVRDARCAIGLGGIAKGYAVDSVASYIRKSGFRDFIIEAGGDMYVSSTKPKTVGITHPRVPGGIIDTVYVKDKAVATSGDYEKFVIDNGVRYCHIINPSTGYGTSDLIAVTIISDKAYLSDAFATAAFVMGREKAKYFIEKNNVGGLIYYLSDGGEVISEEINIKNYRSNSK